MYFSSEGHLRPGVITAAAVILAIAAVVMSVIDLTKPAPAPTTTTVD
jgi:hypothetical protein